MDDQAPPDLAYTHTRLRVSAFGDCFHSYRDLLGFEVTFGGADQGYADFRTGETTIAPFDRSAMDGAVGRTPATEADGSDTISLIFGVDSVDEAFERLAPDVDVITEPTDRPDWGIRTAHFCDPDGALLEINESPQSE